MQADIFCRVVDNYGDIGVCWRLTRRLAEGHRWQVRLWVDDLRAFARLQPGVAADAARQTVQGVDVIHWTAQPPELEPGDVVIEAFACDPPAAFIRAMQRRRDTVPTRAPIWINLEYLSAESWVEGCHGLPSQRPDGLTKYFFFPGFTPATGGLLREPGLSAERDAFQADRHQQEPFLRGLGLDDDAMRHWQSGARVVSLFCYPHAPVDALVRALVNDARPSLLLVPEGVAAGLEQTARSMSAAGTAAADASDAVKPARAAEAASAPSSKTTPPRVARGTSPLKIARAPFVPQPDFDRLLWCADLNFVRGEDSFVRAAWAARPLVWQIYPQDEDAHLEKLDAWLARYPGPPEAQALIRAWNMTMPQDVTASTPPAAADGNVSSAPRPDAAPVPARPPSPPLVAAALEAALQSPAWENWQSAARAWDAAQAKRPDLGDSLAEFCAELSKKR